MNRQNHDLLRLANEMLLSSDLELGQSTKPVAYPNLFDLYGGGPMSTGKSRRNGNTDSEATISQVDSIEVLAPGAIVVGGG